MGETQETIVNVPKESSEYVGQYIVFFSEDENPEVLFHTISATEAYKKAEEIKVETKRDPVVIRVGGDIEKNIQTLTRA